MLTEGTRACERAGELTSEQASDEEDVSASREKRSRRPCGPDTAHGLSFKGSK